MRRLLAVTIPPAVLAVVAAGCGGSPAGTAAGPYGHSASRPAAGTVTTAHTSLGSVLVDGQGRTVYLFEKDKDPASSCYGACASVWPPVTGAARPGAGIAAAKLRAVKRDDGKAGLTYAGHPLYTYAGDGRRGDVNGQGLDQFGGEWYAVSPNGVKVDHG